MATNIFEKVNENVDIVDVVREYVTLEQKGKNLFGICPFHDDNNPSMSVSREKGIFYCFTCKMGGNAIKFIQEYKHMSPYDAALFLARQYHIDVSEFVNNSGEKTSTKRYYDLMSTTQRFYSYLMNNVEYSKEAREYLSNRGINDNIIKDFNIGLSPRDGEGLRKTMLSKNFLDTDLSILGLTSSDKDIFVDRVMVPIKDEMGRAIAFGGRIYKKDSTQAKYINSKETPIFKKGEVVFNIDRASKDRSKNYLILNEGYMDVIQSASHGIDNAIALMGTSITKEQVQTIKKYTNKVAICLDGDMPGMEGVKAIIREFDLAKIEYTITILPNDMDPDEVLRKHGKDFYLDLIENKKLDKIGYYYELTKRRYGELNIFNIDTFKQDIFRQIKDINSKTALEAYLRRLSMDLKVSFESLSQDFKTFIYQENNGGTSKKYDQSRRDNPFIVKSKIRSAEELVISYSIESKEFYDLIVYKMSSKLFLKSKDLREEFIFIGDLYTINKNITKDEILKELSLKNYPIIPSNKTEFSTLDLVDNVLKTYHEYEIDEELEELKELLKSPSKDINKDEIIKRQMDLLKEKKTLKESKRK